MTKTYKILTRGSPLAMWQAKYVQDFLNKVGISTEIQIIKTTGDRIKDKSLQEIGGKGVFIKEIEQALIQKKGDFGVHSLKDLAAEVKSPFALPCFFSRHPAEDLLIFHPSWSPKLKELPETLRKEDFQKLGDLRIATGSLRRSCLLKEANSNTQILPMRGNIETRLRKLKEENHDAIVLSKAAIHRMGLSEEYPSFTLDPSWFVPCAGQGVIAIECLEDHPLREKLTKLSDKKTEEFVNLERKILAYLGGDCTLPVGVHTFEEGSKTRCNLVIFKDGRSPFKLSIQRENSSFDQFYANVVRRLEMI